MANIEKLPLFVRCVIQNFPFIEEDFDALTNYELISKVVEFLNKVISSQNEVINVSNELQVAFQQLQNYIENYFDNLDLQEEVNHKLDEMVEDGTLTELISTYLYTKLFKASEIGMVTTNDEASAISNFNLLKTKMEAGFNILIDGKYYIKNTDPSKSINIISNQSIQGEDKDSELSVYDNQYLYLFDANNFDLTIRNLKFTNSYAHQAYIIKDNNTNEEKYKYGSFVIEGCNFIGSIQLIDFYNLESNLRDETWGIPYVKVNDNFFENSESPTLGIFNVPFGEVEINNNIIHNIKPVFGRFNPTHNEADSQGSEFMRCVKADANRVYYDDDVFVENRTYCAFLVCACRNAIVTNNYIEGLKANDGTAVYSAYLSCYNVVFENNIVKNVINFYSADNNYIFKAKYGLGTRIYRNNTITLDPTWVASINSSLASPYSESDLASHTTTGLFHSDGHNDKWIIDGNTISVLRIDNKTRYKDITYFEFINNNIRCTQVSNYLMYPQTNNIYTHIIGNQFYISENSNGFTLVQGGSYQNTCDIVIKDNIINGNISYATLVNSEGSLGNIDIENNRITLASTSTVSSSSVRGVLLLRNSSYSSLTLKNNIWSNNKTVATLMNICNGKLDIDQNFVTAGMDTGSNVDTYYLDKTVLFDQKLLITLDIMNSSGVFETSKYIITLHNDGENSYVKYVDTSDVEQDLNITSVGSNTTKDVKPDTGTSKLTVSVRSTSSYITFKALTTYSRKVRLAIESI